MQIASHQNAHTTDALNQSGQVLPDAIREGVSSLSSGCFIAGTLVHTQEGLRPIEQIRAGDWVLSRPEDPAQGADAAYKRVTQTFLHEGRPVLRVWWAPNLEAAWEQTESLYATPDQRVWLSPHGWVAMERLYLPGKGRPGSILRGEDEFRGRDLVLADGRTAVMLDVFDLYRTDQPLLAYQEEDDWSFGTLVDFSGDAPVFGDDLPYDYEKWGDPVNEVRERYTTTVYQLEVEDWHSFFVGQMGLWVRGGMDS